MLQSTNKSIKRCGDTSVQVFVLVHFSYFRCFFPFYKSQWNVYKFAIYAQFQTWQSGKPQISSQFWQWLPLLLQISHESFCYCFSNCKMKTGILTYISRRFYGAKSCSQHSPRSTDCWPAWLHEAWNWLKILINAIAMGKLKRKKKSSSCGGSYRKKIKSSNTHIFFPYIR